MEGDTGLAVVDGARASRHDLRSVFQPRSLEQALDLAERVASSEICPLRYRDKPADVFVAAAYGAEIGLSFMQSVQGVTVINGIPTIYGDHALGLVRASGLCQYVNEWIDETNADNLIAHCSTHRKGEPQPVTRSFSEDDAERAGLLGKAGPWQTHEKRMLQMRARGFCLRDTYADVLRGLTLTEELEGETLMVGDGAPLTPGPARRVTAEAVSASIPMPRALPGAAEPEATTATTVDAVAPETTAPAADAVADAERASASDALPDAGSATAADEPVELPRGNSEPEPARYFVDGVTQRTGTDRVVYTVVLRPLLEGENVVARTADRELALAACTARRNDRMCIVELATDDDLGVMLVALATPE